MEKAYKLEFPYEKSGSLFVNCCGCAKTEPFHSFGPAVKPHFLIHYILSGKGIFRMDGKQYPLEAGYGFLIEPEELAFYQADKEEPWTYVWVGFAGTKAKETVENMGLSNSHPIFHSEKSDELYGIVREMMEYNTFGLANDLRRNGLLGIFLATIADSAEVTEKSETDKANNYVRKAIEFIQRNYCNPIKVTDVADYVCINRSYLSTLFQSCINMSPQQFLATFRITKATELLQITELPIESIALSCGYHDPFVFTKAFRQMKGISPSGYRKLQKEGNSQLSKEHLQQLENFIKQMNI